MSEVPVGCVTPPSNSQPQPPLAPTASLARSSFPLLPQCPLCLPLRRRHRRRRHRLLWVDCAIATSLCLLPLRTPSRQVALAWSDASLASLALPPSTPMQFGATGTQPPTRCCAALPAWRGLRSHGGGWRHRYDAVRQRPGHHSLRPRDLGEHAPHSMAQHGAAWHSMAQHGADLNGQQLGRGKKQIHGKRLIGKSCAVASTVHCSTRQRRRCLHAAWHVPPKARALQLASSHIFYVTVLRSCRAATPTDKS